MMATRYAAITLLTAIMSAGVGATITAAKAEDIRFYNWADYIDPDVLAAFTEETGITVIEESYAEGDLAEARLLAGGTGYDLAVISATSLTRMQEADALQPLDRSRVFDASRGDPRIATLMDGIGPDIPRMSALYLWGHTGIIVDTEAVNKRAPDARHDSWSLIFDPEIISKLADCGVGIVDSVDEVVSAALSYLGRDPTSTAPADIDAAFATISAIAPFVQSFDSSHYDRLVDGDLCVALIWNSDGAAIEIEEERKPYRFHTPVEGTNAWFDVFVLPSDAVNTDAAYRLMEFIYRPENMGDVQNWGYAAGFVPDSTAHLEDEIAGHPAVFPPEDTIARFHTLPLWDSSEKAALDRRWRRAMIGLR